MANIVLKKVDLDYVELSEHNVVRLLSVVLEKKVPTTEYWVVLNDDIVKKYKDPLKGERFLHKIRQALADGGM